MLFELSLSQSKQTKRKSEYCNDNLTTDNRQFLKKTIVRVCSVEMFGDDNCLSFYREGRGTVELSKQRMIVQNGQNNYFCWEDTEPVKQTHCAV